MPGFSSARWSHVAGKWRRSYPYVPVVVRGVAPLVTIADSWDPCESSLWKFVNKHGLGEWMRVEIIHKTTLFFMAKLLLMTSSCERNTQVIRQTFLWLCANVLLGYYRRIILCNHKGCSIHWLRDVVVNNWILQFLQFWKLHHYCGKHCPSPKRSQTTQSCYYS